MWQTIDNQLYKKYEFKDFDEAFNFMTLVKSAIDERNHHPKWTNEWNTVEIWLSTHDAGSKVTDKDQDLAKAIDAIYGDLNQRPKVKASSDIKIYTDGGSRGNPGPAASGYVLFDGDDKVIEKKGIYLGVTTNNQAEYQALKFALESAQKHQGKNLDIYMDSLLIVNQIKGVYKVKNADLLPIYNSIKELINTFDEVSFTHVPRALNSIADGEVNKALDAA